MKLTDRGVSYESNPPVLELTAGEIGGKYRGADWRHYYPRHMSVPQPGVDLKYRGVAYCIGDPIDVEASLLHRHYANAAPAKDEAIATVSSRRKVLDELANTHVANIRHSLEHRLQVAKAKGDQNLIRLLEAEAEQMAQLPSSS